MQIQTCVSFVFLGDVLNRQCKNSSNVFRYIETMLFVFCLDEIRRTLGEGTFGKVVEVRDLRG